MPLFEHGAEFFDLFERQADSARQAAKEFSTLGSDFSNSRGVLDSLSRLEGNADRLTHDLNSLADSKFITPFDKDDLHHLTVALDDLTDQVEAASARIVIFHIDKPRPDFAHMTDLVSRAMEATHRAVCGLRSLNHQEEMHQALIAVHSIEEESDKAYRSALDTLFGEQGADPMNVMKWKDIYDRIEITIDRCEDVADLLETMAVKYA